MKIQNIEELINQNVKILESQSTFLIIEFKNDSYRIDFEDKTEFLLKKGTIGKLNIESENPLLINYQENFVITYINSPFENPEKILDDLREIINSETHNTRNWKSYFESKPINLTLEIIKNNIKNGHGKFCEAPISISKKIVEYCDSLNIKTKTFYEKNYEIKPYKILSIENNYVIAMNFKLHIERDYS